MTNDTIKLASPWGGHPEGQELAVLPARANPELPAVDATRARALIDSGLAYAEQAPPTPNPRPKKRKKR